MATFYSVHTLFAIVGFTLLVLSLFSKNSAFRNNLDIIWTLPALVVILSKRKLQKRVEILYSILLLSLVFVGDKIFAGFSHTYIPLIVCLIFICLIDLGAFKLLKNKLVE